MNAFDQAKILETDAEYFGMSRSEMVGQAGEKLAEGTSDRIKKDSTITVVCGLGNNGADGLACACSLFQMIQRNKKNDLKKAAGKSNSAAKIRIVIIGRPQDFKTPEIQEQFARAKKLKNKNFQITLDAYAKDIEPSDIIIEALLGSGIKGKLRKRFKDVVDKIARMKAVKIAVDSPVPGYKPDQVLSLLTPKRKTAKLLGLDLPEEVQTYLGPGLIRFLHKPVDNDYKRTTGELLVFGGSELFHGAPVMAMKAASKFIGSIFFYTNPENRQLINKQKLELDEFISLREQDLEKFSNYANIILAGPGLEENDSNRAVLTYLLNKYPEKTFVLDAYAIALANPINSPQNKRGFKNCILTPHRGELRHIFPNSKNKNLEGNLKRFCIENDCMLVLKGHIDRLYNQNGVQKMNKTGNPGMAKGGTGDVLCGLIAALACKNAPWDALRAGTFLNGIAGDMAKKDFGFNYSATDLIPYLQKAYKWAEEY